MMRIEISGLPDDVTKAVEIDIPLIVREVGKIQQKHGEVRAAAALLEAARHAADFVETEILEAVGRATK